MVKKQHSRWLLAGLAASLFLAGCAKPSASETEPEAAPADYAAAFSQGKEARAWMATGKNHMFEASDEVCRKVIEDLYRLGAVEVRVTDADKFSEDSPGEIAATLVAKLPSDPDRRKALLDYEKENTEDADSSTHREYVEIVFD